MLNELTGDTHGYWHIPDRNGWDYRGFLYGPISWKLQPSHEPGAAYAAIGNDLNELQKTSWIATSYLLTLTSFQYVS